MKMTVRFNLDIAALLSKDSPLLETPLTLNAFLEEMVNDPVIEEAFQKSMRQHLDKLALDSGIKGVSMDTSYQGAVLRDYRCRTVLHVERVTKVRRVVTRPVKPGAVV
jgi:hypothetical protein